MELIFLHGGAAAGKLTVARELSRTLGFGVFHNHLVVDALTAVFTFGTPPFVALREQFWLLTFREAAAAGISIIFTFAPEPTVAAGFPERARTAVEEFGGRVHFVELTVSDEEQERRIGLPSRREFAKLSSVETLRRLRSDGGEPSDAPPTDLTIDTDSTLPAESASRIVDRFGLVPVDRQPRYPV
jgi:chloramphenicol 3-O-phosphotransferase